MAIKALITGGMPDYLMDKISVPGYDFSHIEDPDDHILAEAEVIIGFPPIDRLGKATALRWLQIPWSGADGYADHPNFPRHVILTNATGAFGRPIAEHVLAAVFALMRRFPLYRDNQNRRVWERVGDELSPTGKHVLIMGAGDIGGNTAILFKKFDCHVTGVRRVVRDCPAHFDEMLTLEQAESALPNADIVICAMPNTPLTRGYFDRRRIAMMKPGAIFVNVGRGNIVDHYALAEALSNGKLFGAALDVTEPEPLPADHPLWKCPNLLLTPHVSGQTFMGLRDKEEFFFALCRRNLENYRDGKTLENMVDLSTGYRVTTG